MKTKIKFSLSDLLNSEKYEIYGDDKEYYFRLNQDIIYNTSKYLDKIWYRKIFGGKWRLIKLGKDTPHTKMFCHWTKLEDKFFSGYIEVLDTEEYEETGVDTKYKVLKQFLKNLNK